MQTLHCPDGVIDAPRYCLDTTRYAGDASRHRAAGPMTHCVTGGTLPFGVLLAVTLWACVPSIWVPLTEIRHLEFLK